DAVGDGLGEGNEIGRYAEPLRAEARSNTTKAGNDFIEDEQYAVSRADLSQSLKVAARRNDYTRRALHGLHDHRCDGVGSVPCSKVFQFVGKMRTPGRLSFGEAHFRSVVSMWKVVDGRQHERGEHGTVVCNPAHRRPADSDSMVAALAANQSCTTDIAADAM